MRGSQIFANAIEDLDLYPVFGNPGTTELPALRNIKSYILTLHDSISVGMADGLAQYSGKVKMVNLHTLPGLANSMAFIYTAKMNHTPLIITAGQQDMRHMVLEPILYYNLENVISDAVKFKYELRNVDDIEIAMKRAKLIAQTPPTGPVFLSLPMNIMDMDGTYSKMDDFNFSYELINIEAVKEISEKIMRAKNPAIVFGYEIDIFNAFKEAEEFAEKLGCPVFGEPLSSRAVFNTENTIFAGDLMPGSTLINLSLLNNDLIVFIGGDITLYPYLPSPILPGKDLIFIGLNISPKMGNFYQMNPKLFLKESMKYIEKKCNYSRPKDLTFATKIANERSSLGFNYVMYQTKKFFKDYTIVDESISASYTLRNILGYKSKGYFTAKSGQLGWGLPASAGIAMQNKKVLLVIGDGSFMYTMQTLWTLKKYNIPLKIVVLRNNAYNILRSFAKSYYPEMENSPFLKFELEIERFAQSFGIQSQVAGNDLKELSWLAEGEDPKVLVIDVDKNIPKLFL
ncbi:MAG: thiamine pyrophosphate-binding protein [Thermoplasmata archaeon]|nr:thiamine pyrophosphate-binding protein [Thermoplasmata archaeon]